MNMRKTKIICTLGPAVDHAETIERLIRTGMNAARFNFSHGSHAEQLARLNMFKDQYKEMSFINNMEIMDMTEKACMSSGLFPYYLYRQKNMAGNLENVGYARPGKEGIYNILIMEEKQSILALGAGASTKRVWPEANEDGTHRIERCENVKDVASYISRIDEMIERKQKFFAEV